MGFSELIGKAVDSGGVAILVVGVVLASVAGVLNLLRRQAGAYENYRRRAGPVDPAGAGVLGGGRHHPHGGRHAHLPQRRGAGGDRAEPDVPQLLSGARNHRTVALAKASVGSGAAGVDRCMSWAEFSSATGTGRSTRPSRRSPSRDRSRAVPLLRTPHPGRVRPVRLGRSSRCEAIVGLTATATDASWLVVAVAVVVIMVTHGVVTRLRFVTALRRVIDPPLLVLVRDGVVDRHNLRRCGMTADEPGRGAPRAWP